MNRLNWWAIAIFILLHSSISSADEYFGKYSGNVRAEWLQDGRQMKVLEDFNFEDPNGLTWSAPKNSVVDGASIPTLAWIIVGAPFSGKYRDASVIHDIACQEKNRTWEVVHLAFYYGMRASGVGVAKAKTMYAAVYHFGPRWPIEEKVKSIVYQTSGSSKKHCMKMPLGDRVCFDMPETKSAGDRVVEFAIKIPPPDKILTEKKFEELVAQIEKSENSSSPMSLEQINAFK
ncbi:DUF1353 domain-containing protein [Marinomonas sp. CT5]|uniref:DUF1353 domain-containing protein n=1 Tax=Marinomonas sp. CT5 TaxID=2066133 RepID=UPI001BAF1DDC|nr:DUF1353 domain-containing protein [Marinomonas sp. CT5]